MTLSLNPIRRRRSAPPSLRRRKNLFVDQAKLDRAKKALGAATETEAIDRALDLAEDFAAFQQEAQSSLDSLLGRGGFVDLFSGDEEEGVAA